jgi:photosystem II stability/assembly factor-like uncharacterized protein
MEIPGGNSLGPLLCLGEAELYAVNVLFPGSRTALHSTDSGQSWMPVSIPLPAITGLWDIAVDIDREPLVVGDSGTVMAFANGAAHPVYQPSDANLHGIWIGKNGEGVIVGTSGTILTRSAP